MRTRRLGRTGLDVSVVSLGSWLTYGGSVGEDEAVACIHRAFALGVNLFDTANVYERGGAEAVLGRALAPLPRERFLVATKVFGEMGPGPTDRGLGERHVREQCEASLRRLGLDVIDLYQCHRYDPDTPLEETCRVMDELVRPARSAIGAFRNGGPHRWRRRSRSARPRAWRRRLPTSRGTRCSSAPTRSTCSPPARGSGSGCSRSRR